MNTAAWHRRVALGVQLLLGCCAVAASTSSPVSYWRFEDPEALGTDSSNTPIALKPRDPGAWVPKPFAGGGIVGGFAEIANTSLAAAGGPFPRTATANGITVEFLFRTGRDFHRTGNTTLFAAIPSTLAGDGWIEGGMLRHSLVWRADASLKPDNGECQSEQDRVLLRSVPCSLLEVPLDQAGRRTMFYINDGNWHHIAYRKAAVTGEQSIWLDGQVRSYFLVFVPTISREIRDFYREM
eukprot:SAG31_NODE_4434_length_3233_cov_1.725909_4_plen_239_part_00